MSTIRGAWSLAGLVAGAAGLATSYAVANVMSVRTSPVVAVAELVIRLTPGEVVEQAIGFLGFNDKPVLVAGVLVVLAALFAWAGRLAARRWWAPVLLFGALAAVGAAAVATQEAPTTTSYLPVAVGFVTWLLVLSALTARIKSPAPEPVESAAGLGTRRGFLFGAAGVAVISLGLGVLGRLWGSGRRRVEASRRLLRLTGVSEPSVPPATKVGLDGVSPWLTHADDFYLIHTAIALPTIVPDEWRLRIHGMVDREVTLTFQDLLARKRTEAWVTLNCVSNLVGGDLIGNAWWSGVRLATILDDLGVSSDADAVLQTSDDGWTCSTPLAALTDGRDAMLAIAMNGRPLQVEHGFPVRTIVPGLYGFVSACKWVVDLEVTRFDRIEAYWTGKGWAEQAPVRLASRIDVPRDGASVEAGELRVGGVAWQQQVGIRQVEISLDGGGWEATSLGKAPSIDTWVQWAGTITVAPGDHVLRVRAISADGEVQTGVERDVVPDGATGWHEVEFSAEGR
ncbi:molybdopterin-dependent oxidoreductase [Nocardioides sp.]|uniref:molybdopterin-dependent oxidoreductase n=1 Tax=Nocardioides sp. TaxID=35761 RepID=UPI002ED26F78